uniref:Uncharacterized protein n=1 Tax=Chromera velia CCMP2878 TaxID=1169474 RepID=A0A0G4FZ56_9ALVE|eukprot:Cvel_19499.t1-p1 / transcript=Cvel_19499.t1 / gene=Cvel_19499 / organism=Chromera_velia_CCMP2878 / gene_product=hypothetical protein / transcript_product=hypothetical protein / location=Cvel_scaffold1686:35906-36538(-) / protein_length=211 / sequence_SO=supercontig / SO=protein_coding / is_pseudo=false
MDDADIIKWVRQYADAVAILGDSDEWCGRLTLTNRNKVGVNIKHYIARTEVEMLEKVVERVFHLSSEVSEQLRIFYRHVVDCVSPPDAEWMKRYLQWTDVLRIGKVRIMDIRELLSLQEKEKITGPQLKALNEQILCLQTLKKPSSLSLSRPVSRRMTRRSLLSRSSMSLSRVSVIGTASYTFMYDLFFATDLRTTSSSYGDGVVNTLLKC